MTSRWVYFVLFAGVGFFAWLGGCPPANPGSQGADGGSSNDAAGTTSDGTAEDGSDTDGAPGGAGNDTVVRVVVTVSDERIPLEHGQARFTVSLENLPAGRSYDEFTYEWSCLGRARAGTFYDGCMVPPFFVTFFCSSSRQMTG